MRYIFKFPDIGEGLDEGKIIQWYVKKGQSITSGTPLVKMETDKVVTDIPSPKTGVIVTLFGNAGDTVHVGNPLVEIDLEGVVGKDAQHEAATGPARPTKVAVQEVGFGVVGTLEVAGDGAYLPSSGEGLAITKEKALERHPTLATPVARNMAKELGIDIDDIVGTGPAGRVTKKDIQSYYDRRQAAAGQVQPGKSTAIPAPAIISAPPLASRPVTAAMPSVVPTPPTVARGGDSKPVEILPVSQIRKTIAKNMIRSKQNAAHMTIMDDVEVSELVRLKTQYAKPLAAQNLRLSYLPFVLKAVAKALQNHPLLNSELDLEHERIIQKRYYHIGIAVDTAEGLVVPVIHDVDKKPVLELARELNSIAVRARERKLTLEEMKDGTFTVTNYGSLGGAYGVPVIAYPQVGILGIGRIEKKPVVSNDQIVVGQLMGLSLSVDHRLIDGGTAVRFLQDVAAFLKDPVFPLLF